MAAPPQRVMHMPCVVILLLLFLFLATYVVAFDDTRVPYDNIDPRLIFLSAVVRNATVAGGAPQEGFLPAAATVAVDAVSHHMFTGHARPPGPPDSAAPSLVGGRQSPPRRDRPPRPRMSSYLDHIPTPGVVNRSFDTPPGPYEAGPSTAPFPSPSMEHTPSMTDPEIISHPSDPSERGAPAMPNLTRDLLTQARDGTIDGGTRCRHAKCADKPKIYMTWREYHKHVKSHGERYQCRENCDRKFAYKSKLKDHERSCADTRTFLCTACGQRFNRKHTQERHSQKHCSVVLHQERM